MNKIAAHFATTVFTFAFPAIAFAQQPLGDTGEFTYDRLVIIVTELVKILLRIGGFAAVIAVVWYGLQMVLARGDAAKFNAAKKGLGLALIGAAIIFGVFTIIATIQEGVKSVGGN